MDRDHDRPASVQHIAGDVRVLGGQPVDGIDQQHRTVPFQGDADGKIDRAKRLAFPGYRTGHHDKVRRPSIGPRLVDLCQDLALDSTEALRERGARTVEVLKQGQYQPMDVVDQVLSIYAGTRGHLDEVPRTEVAQWEKGFLTFMRDQKPEIRKKIAETKDLDDAGMEAINQAIKEYKAQYATRKKESREVVRV